MKKAISLIFVMSLFGIFSEAHAQVGKALKKGFSIKAQLGFPPGDYGMNEPVDSEFAYGAVWGLQIGNQWYFSPKETYGFGLMVNWLDVSYARKKTSNAQGDFDRGTTELAFLELGPLGTYALSEVMAVDAYYNLRPGLMSTGYSFNDGDEEGAFGGFGLTHAFGAGLRYSVLYIGLEYVLGSIKVSQATDEVEDLEGEKMRVDNFRILVGVKF